MAGEQPHHVERMLIWIIVGLTLIRLALLPLYPILDKSEARYATVSMWMEIRGDWITPTVDGVTPFWAKPPLAFWLSALSCRVFGINEFAVRLPSFLIFVATTWMVYAIGHVARDRIFGLLAAGVFATMGLTYYLAGAVLTDPILGLCTTLSMVAFWIAMTRGGSLAGYLVFMAFGLSILAKGPIGLLLPGAAIISWSIWDKRFPDLFRKLPVVTGLPLMLAICLPWYLMAEHKTPGFLNYFIVGEHFHRFLDPGWKGDLYGAGRRTPVGMIWLDVVIASMPWCLVIFWSLFRDRPSIRTVSRVLQQSWFRFLLVWCLVPLIFFTFARNTLITYVVPSLPPLALLVAHLLRERQWTESPIRLALVMCGSPLVLVGAVGLNNFFPNANVLPSQSRLVALSEITKKSEAQQLVYLYGLPYSAVFYTRGHVLEATPEQAAELIQTGKAQGIAVDASRQKQLPEPLLNKLKSVGLRDGTVLFIAKTAATTD